MIQRTLIGLLACGIFALAGCKKESSGGGSDDPTEYTINLRRPSAGSEMRGTFKIDMRMSMVVTNGAKPQEKKDVNIKDEIVYRETIIEMPAHAKKPTRSSILIEKWNRGKDGGFGDDEVRRRIVGREVLFQKMGREYEFRAKDGGPIEPNLRIYLSERYNELIENFSVEDFLPRKPVKKDEPWHIDVKKLLRAAMKTQNQGSQIPLDTENAKGSGRLLSTTTKDGRKYGTIELRVDFGKLDPKEPGVKISTMGKMELVFTIEACIDGSLHDVKANAKMEFGIEASHPTEGSAKVNLKLAIDMVDRETPGTGKPNVSNTQTSPVAEQRHDDASTEDFKPSGSSPIGPGFKTPPVGKGFEKPRKDTDPPRPKPPIPPDFDASKPSAPPFRDTKEPLSVPKAEPEAFPPGFDKPKPSPNVPPGFDQPTKKASEPPAGAKIPGPPM